MAKFGVGEVVGREADGGGITCVRACQPRSCSCTLSFRERVHHGCAVARIFFLVGGCAIAHVVSAILHDLSTSLFKKKKINA